MGDSLGACGEGREGGGRGGGAMGAGWWWGATPIDCV